MSTQERWIPDASALSAFRENPEGFRLKYRLHLSHPSPEFKMDAGSAIHAARNVLFSGGTLEDAIAQAREIRGPVEGPRNADQVEALVRAYAARYPRAEEEFSVVCSEEYAEAEIVIPDNVARDCTHVYNPPQCCDHPRGCHPETFMYCGILDSVVRFPDGSEYVMDLKTTGAYLNDQWCTMMSLSDQMTGYVAIRRALGHRCDGYIVDGVRVNDYVPKGKTVPNIDLAKDFVRFGPVRVPEWRVERWARDVAYTLRQIAALEAERGTAEPWPLYQNWPYGKVDAFKDFYETPAELHAETAKLFEVRTWDPKAVAAGRAHVPAIAEPLNAKDFGPRAEDYPV
jgi:hypothetical protein